MNKDLKEALDDLRKIEKERTAKETEVQKAKEDRFETLKANNWFLRKDNDYLAQSLKKHKEQLDRIGLWLDRSIEDYESLLEKYNGSCKELSKLKKENKTLCWQKSKTSKPIKAFIGCLLIMLIVTLAGLYAFQQKNDRSRNMIFLQAQTIETLEQEKLEKEETLKELVIVAVDLATNLETCEKQLKEQSKTPKKEQKETTPKKDYIPTRPRPKKNKAKVWVKLCGKNDPLGCLKRKNARDM